MLWGRGRQFSIYFSHHEVPEEYRSVISVVSVPSVVDLGIGKTTEDTEETEKCNVELLQSLSFHREFLW